jgi:hypothetical protein
MILNYEKRAFYPESNATFVEAASDEIVLKTRFTFCYIDCAERGFFTAVFARRAFIWKLFGDIQLSIQKFRNVMYFHQIQDGGCWPIWFFLMNV